MDTHSIIKVLLIFSAAIAVIVISKQIKIPAVIGFILTGIIWSAFSPQDNHSASNLQYFGQIGIVFLLFLVGLDISPQKVKRLSRVMLIGGGLQAIITVAIALIIAALGFLSFTTAILCAFVIIQSSTAIALKVYHDRGEINAPHAETSIGISLFQDISAVILLITIPILGTTASSTASLPLISLGVNLMILCVITVSAYFLLPLLLRIVVVSGVREIVILLALVFCFGLSFVSEHLGFSMALGAFICGIMLNRSEYHSQIIADFAPLRDVFLSLFFISIGLSFNWSFTLAHIWTIAFSTLVAIGLKMIILYSASRASSFPFRTSLLAATGLANIGEFGFILMISAVPYGLLTQNQFQAIGSTAILSMLCTPLLFTIIARVTLKCDKINSGTQSEKVSGKDNPRIVIVGFGLAGRQLAHTLKTSNISYSVIEVNGREVTRGLADNEPILYGDAARWETLERSGIETAQIMVVLISDSGAIKSCIGIARRINPKMTIVCRTRRMNDIEQLLKAGANEVISEEFETSIELFTVVLNHLHVPRNIIRAQTRLLRSDGYEMLRVPSPVKGISDKLLQILACGTTDVFQVMNDHFAVGKSLKSLELRRITGAMVITVVKSDKNITNPPPDLVLESGESLVIVGSHAQMESAFEYLENGPVDEGKNV